MYRPVWSLPMIQRRTGWKCCGQMRPKCSSLASTQLAMFGGGWMLPMTPRTPSPPSNHQYRLAFNGGSRLFSLPRPPLFSSLLASSASSHIYWRDSLCTALQTRKLWIWSTGLSVQLIPSSQGEVWVLGNPFVPTGRSRPDIRGMHGRGGKSYVWRLFLWRTLRISTFSAPW